MTTKLSSLRVTAEMDVSQYVRAAAQKVSADGDMVGSAKAVGQALAATDAAASKAVPGVASLSRVWITGYGDAAKFESAVRSIGRALDRGMDPARAAAQLDGVYRKFGQTADAASLARQGFVALAPVVTALNERYDVTAAVADRAAAATKRLADAQSTQQRINASFGIGTSAGSAQASADAFLGSVGGIEGVAAARARAIAESFNHTLNEALIAGAPRSARQSASAFTEYFDGIAAEIKRRETEIAAAAARIQAVQDRLTQVHRIGYQFDSTPGARASMSAFLEEDERAVKSLTQAYDPLLTNEQRRNEALKTAQGLLSRQSVDEAQYARIVANVSKVHDDTKRALEGAFTATGKYASGVGLARHELINLGRQAQDVFVSLASGQSPITVLIQQGTQIGDIFAASRGSVGGFFKELPGLMLAAAAPMAAVAAGLAAIGAAYAALSRSEQQSSLSRSLLGAGRGVGLTGEAYNGQALISADAADITITSARQVAAEYAKLGQIAATNLPQLTRLTKEYALVTGQDLKQSAQDLSRALADPEKGADQLADKLGVLDTSTVRAIRTALSYNDTLRAQKLLMEGIAQATSGAIESQSAWERLKSGAGRLVDLTVEGAARLVVGDSDEEARQKRLNDLLAQRAGLQAQLQRDEASGSRYMARDTQARINNLSGQIAELERAKQASEGFTEARARHVREEGKVNAAAAIGMSGLQQTQMGLQLAQRAVSSYSDSLKILEERRDAAAKADPSGGLSKEVVDLTLRIEENKRGLEAATKQLNDYRGVRSGLTIDQERDLRVQEAQAKGIHDVTLAQRQATAERVKEAQSYGTALGLSQQATEAAKARRDVEIEARRQQQSNTKASNDNVAALSAEIQALNLTGEARARVSRIWQESLRESEATDQNPRLIFQRRMTEAMKETEKQQATLIAQQKQANQAAGAGNVVGLSPQQRQNRQELAKVEAEIAEYRKANLLTDRQAEEYQKRRLQGLQDEQSLRAKGAANDYFYQQGQELESLRKQRDLIFATRDMRIEELEVLRATQFVREQGLDTETGIGKQIIDRSRELGKEKQISEDILRIRNQIKQAQDFASDSMKTFLNDLLTSTDGLSGALKNLGKGFLSASLDAFIGGKGPLAGITGLASSTKDGQGGILGLLSGNLKPFSDAVAKGTAKGSAEGFETGWHRAAANDNSSFFRNINSKDLAGGLTAIAGLAGSYGSGMAAGSYAQAGIGGALSGGMAGLSLAGTSIGASLGGASVLGPVGAAIGIGLAIYGQQQARKQQKKEQRRQAYEAYQEAAPQIAQLGSQFRGDPQGTIAQRIAEAETAWRKLGDVAVVAGRPDDAVKLHADFVTYRERLLGEFRASFGGMIDALKDGTGPNSPFASARDSVKSLGDQLKVFVDDTKTAFGADAPQIEQARQAARDYALSVLDGARQMSVAATRMEEIRGASAGLQQVLVDLGMSAEQAAAAISEKTTAALDRLKDAFRDELIVKVNEVEGVGYINEIENLFKEAASRRNDASLLGTLEKDGPLIERWLRGASQQVVDSARLTGEAFDRLLGALPFVADYVHEFQEELDATAKAADIAARKLAYQDRLFAALNDTSTLEGQLAAFDRTALRDREAEIKAGGEAILDLEAAQAAERFKIIKEYNQKAIDDQKAALREAETFLASFTRNIQQYLDGLRAGSDSPLSPQARLQAAQSQYAAQLALAQGGNRDALNGITGYASDLLDAAKAYYASSSGFQGIFAQIQSQLAALPNQVSAEQLIVNAINASRDALLLKMNELDTNGDGMISKQEAANTWLSSIFNELDINGDAQLSKFEQLLYADGVTRAQLKAAIESGPSGTANVLASYFNAIDRNTSQSIDFGEMQSALKGMASDSQLRDMFTRLDTDNSGSISRLEAIKGATDGTGNGVARNVNDQDATLTAIQSLLGTIKDFSRTTDLYIATVQSNTGTQVGILNSINSLTSGQNAVLAVANTSAAQQEFFLNKAWENLRSANSRYFADGNSLPTPQYAEGGYVSGPGTGTSDSIAARLSNGEFVFRKAAVDRFGVGMLDQMNDNFRMPAMPVPVMGGGDMRAVVAELKALRAELAAHKAATVKATVAAAEHVGDEVKLVAAVQSDAAREMRNKAA